MDQQNQQTEATSENAHTAEESANFLGHTYERKVKIVFTCIAAVLLIGLYFVLSDLTVRVLPDPRGLEYYASEYTMPAQPLPDEPAGYARAEAVVTAIVERGGRNYARVEYYMPTANMNCFFHEDIGLPGDVPSYFAGQKVAVIYEPSAPDSCGTSKIDN